MDVVIGEFVMSGLCETLRDAWRRETREALGASWQMKGESNAYFNLILLF